MVVFTHLIRIIILAFHLHPLITTQMTHSGDKHQLPKISQPQSFGSYVFCACLFSSLRLLLLFNFFFYHGHVSPYFWSWRREHMDYIYIYIFFPGTSTYYSIKKSNIILLIAKQMSNQEDNVHVTSLTPVHTLQCPLLPPAPNTFRHTLFWQITY